MMIQWRDGLGQTRRQSAYIGGGFMVGVGGVAVTAVNYAYIVVLDNVVYPIENVVRFRHQQVVDDDLTEYLTTPDAAAWPNNTVRFKHQSVNE